MRVDRTRKIAAHKAAHTRKQRRAADAARPSGTSAISSHSDQLVTPLQPRKFFTGVWSGNGELIPSRLVRWVVPIEHIEFVSRPVWLSETVWMVQETFRFSSGSEMARRMFVEIVEPNRLHVTADDMPLGADIILSEQGFRFTPYYVWANHRGRRWQLRCFDENVIDETGTIHNTIRMFFHGLKVATMYLTVNRS